MVNEETLTFADTVAGGAVPQTRVLIENPTADLFFYRIDSAWLQGPQANPVSLELAGEVILRTDSASQRSALVGGSYVRKPGETLEVTSAMPDGETARYSISLTRIGRDVGPEHVT